MFSRKSSFEHVWKSLQYVKNCLDCYTIPQKNQMRNMKSLVQFSDYFFERPTFRKFCCELKQPVTINNLIKYNCYQLTSNKGQPCKRRQCNEGNLANLSTSSHEARHVLFRFRKDSFLRESCGDVRLGLLSHSLSDLEYWLRSGEEHGLLLSRDEIGQSAKTNHSSCGKARPSLHTSHHSETGFPETKKQTLFTYIVQDIIITICNKL